MFNIPIELMAAEKFQREAGLRKAQLNGTAFEPAPCRRWHLPWRDRARCQPFTTDDAARHLGPAAREAGLQ